ncbi:hypothetical protein FACS1894170_08470 [Planctomycetales bacterium]|nr:hypothetical protein FACS1894170_08470 [Planctomycetales bacterium]
MFYADAAEVLPNDIWRIDTHQVSYIQPDSGSFTKLRYYRFADNRWQQTDADAFYQMQDNNVPLVVFAPGYSSATQQTTNTGLGIVRILDKHKPQTSVRYRIVFWDWYADQTTCRIRSDVRSKIPVAKRAGTYLTLFLQSLKPDSKVCLFGFSFGARIVCRSVQSLPDDAAAKLHLHVVLSGAAVDQHWLGDNSLYGDVVKRAEKVLVTYTSDDWALKFYPYMYEPGTEAEALGLLGVPMKQILPQCRDRIESIDIRRYIGRDHQTLKHAGSLPFRERIDEYFFFGSNR